MDDADYPGSHQNRPPPAEKQSPPRHENTANEQAALVSLEASNDAFDTLDDYTQRLLHIADKLIPDRPLYPYQKEFGHAIISAIVHHSSEEITALFARQAGKTETIARIAVALAIVLPALGHENPESLGQFKHGLWIGIFAPVKHQADTSFERVRGILDSPNGKRLLEKLELKLVEKNQKSRKLNNGSFIRIWSTKGQLESQTLHLAIVEEAQDVPTISVNKSIVPMLSTNEGTLILVGTANNIKSLFLETIERNRKRMGITTEHDAENASNGIPEHAVHFENNWEVVINHNLQYRAFLNKKVQIHGKGWVKEDAFRMAYGCEFILERGQFITDHRLQELADLGKYLARGPYDADGKCVIQLPCVAGIDWGKSGDSTVITVIAKHSEFCQIVDWLEMVGDNYEQQFDSLKDFLKRFPALELILSETNGVGDPMTDRLKKTVRDGNLSAVVEGFHASEARNSDGYTNLLIDFVNANRLLFPADEAARQSREYQTFIRQLGDVRKEWKGSLLKVRCDDASGKSASGHAAHDDYVSSLMMAYWAASRFGSPDLFRQFYGENPHG